MLALGLLVTAMGLAPIHGVAQEKAQNSATKPVPRKDKGWQQRHQQFLERAKKGNVDLLFIGDSITQGWEGSGKEVWKERYDALNAANLGIGGDRTQHVLWRLQEGKELQGISPKAIVLMIGTNNMHDNSAPEILILGIFPRGQQASNPFRDKIKEANQQIAKLDNGTSVRYLDIGDRFLSPDGSLSKEIMPDFLHLSPKGYTIWADAIQPTLQEMLKK
jgi:lysophospholipase L1-like esterase